MIMNVNNILDYLKENQKRISKTSEITELDELAFARISYLPFHKIKRKLDLTKRNFKISEIAEAMKDLPTSAFGWPDDEKFIQLLGKSPRFQNLKVGFFVRKNDKKLEKQFSAVTIQINFFTMYVSFFGTDGTLFGWKEDFNMSFLPEIPAQKEALEYLNNISRRYFYKNFYLGGHSKGGNLSIYSAIMAPDRLQKRILKVLNYDGPGLREELLNRDTGVIRVLPKIVSYIPEGSVIGRLLTHKEKVVVVRSKAKNLYQHDIYTWEIKGENFCRAKNTKLSDILNKTVDDFLASGSPEELRFFMDGIFEVFEKSDVEEPVSLMRNWQKYAPKLMKNYRELPKERRQKINEVWLLFGNSLVKNYFAENEILKKARRILGGKNA